MEDKERILVALASPRYSWRTVDGVSRETGIAPAQVLQIIEGMPDLVIKSRIPDAKGRDLYTTREYYKKTHTFIERLFDQLRSTST